jgi:hypothetical protein
MLVGVKQQTTVECQVLMSTSLDEMARAREPGFDYHLRDGARALPAREGVLIPEVSLVGRPLAMYPQLIQKDGMTSNPVITQASD